ncbi:histidine phosphatase family protein [Spelaeicoccus albus]|uniref:Putative phosphoglycerate mutase n=1 Tax=Spelaeicoccus albus TaxID=1280376 RepID=A0A7Z0D0V0_9MICO|nr:histidine phosphatase family protein [Spelaeicoccus albus]NYI65888.1 putative phosphoglycerate mutase [Spelaeicoccus albus]
MRLLLIRHGQTPSNVAGLLDTAVPGPGLTELGTRQAAALPDRLAGESIDELYASPLLRTQQTAAPLAKRLGLPVAVRDGVREIEAGELAMRGDSGSINAYVSTVFAWARGDVEARIPGGESGVEALRRFDSVIDEIAATDRSCAAVVSHGAAIRLWTASRGINVRVDDVEAEPLRNTEIVVMEGSPDGGWRFMQRLAAG